MIDSKQILITIILSTITVVIGFFSLLINWKNYSKYTKKELENIIKKELNNLFKKTKNKFLDQEKLDNFIYNDKNQDDFYLEYYKVFQNWKKWKKNGKWKPNNQKLNDFLSYRAAHGIEKNNFRKVVLHFFGKENSEKAADFINFYLCFHEFLKWFYIYYDNYNDLTDKIYHFSEILFSEKIYKKLNMIINLDHK